MALSRKVFVGGLPISISTEMDLLMFFSRFGVVSVTWPDKRHFGPGSKIKGYAFLLFKDEISVHVLLNSCMKNQDIFHIEVPFHSDTAYLVPFKIRRIQVRPWYLANRWYFFDQPSELLHRRTIFVGGVPRHLKACELAFMINASFPGVRYVGLDVDKEYCFPKGAARATFFTRETYLSALRARFLSIRYLDHRGIEKKKILEMKPYVVDEVPCDECPRSEIKPRPGSLFCPHTDCLRYLCEPCFHRAHPESEKQFGSHRPLTKDPKVLLHTQ